MNFFSIIALLLISLHLNAGTIEFKCKYPLYADEDGVHSAKNFEMVFMIDSITKKAMMKGNNGLDEINVLKLDNEGISLLSIGGTGLIFTTAIDSNLKSVHSRNSIIGGKLLPSQYYGICKKQ